MHTSAQRSATPLQRACTLEAYAEAKKLSGEFLRELGLSTVGYMGKKAVRMPYLTEDGQEGAVRLRLALNKTEGSDNRFRWRKDSKPALYGLWRMNRIREAGYVVLVEGESDCHTLWHHRVEALGVPGAGNWKEEWTEHLEGVENVYAVIEPDEGGEVLKEKLTASPALHDRLRLVEFDEANDVSELHLADPERFNERLQAAFGRATLWADLDDYAAIRELVVDLVAEGVEATVPKTLRETAEAARRLLEDSEGEPITTAAVAQELRLDKSAALRRVRAAIDRGHLKNFEDRKGRPLGCSRAILFRGQTSVLEKARRDGEGRYRRGLGALGEG